MKVLIASRSSRDFDRYAKALRSVGHDLVYVDSADTLAQAVSRGAPDVAIVCSGEESWIAPLRLPATGHVYIIVALAELGGTSVRKAYEIGADDVMKRVASGAEVVGRVEAVTRIRHWVPRMPADFLAGDDFDVLGLHTIQMLDSLLADELAQMVGVPLESAVGEALPAGVEYAAAVPLNLPSESVELSLVVGVEADSASAFSELLFGEVVPSEVITDAVREFANTAGGAFKRAAMAEGHTFSLGLPVDHHAIAPPTGVKGWVLHTNNMRLTVWVNANCTAPTHVATSDLKEGMVLTQPVRNAAGMVLVAAGSVLTERTVNRLVEMVGPSTLVEVQRAA
jgi:hypothetical protein